MDLFPQPKGRVAQAFDYAHRSGASYVALGALSTHTHTHTHRARAHTHTHCPPLRRLPRGFRSYMYAPTCTHAHVMACKISYHDLCLSHWTGRRRRTTTTRFIDKMCKRCSKPYRAARRRRRRQKKGIRRSRTRTRYRDALSASWVAQEEERFSFSFDSFFLSSPLTTQRSSRLCKSTVAPDEWAHDRVRVKSLRAPLSSALLAFHNPTSEGMDKGKEELGKENAQEMEKEEQADGGVGGEKQMDVPIERLQDLAHVVAASCND